jgi:hypothetical protein
MSVVLKHEITRNGFTPPLNFGLHMLGPQQKSSYSGVGSGLLFLKYSDTLPKDKAEHFISY